MDLQSLGSLPFATVTAAMLFRLLGPTAKYLGGKTQELTEKGYDNIERILLNAQKKLGDRINQPGDVPPRVLRGIMNEGQYCEDKIASEYLGGVLASSRGDSKRDDRGVVMNALISRLSAYQLRTHYIIYHIVKDLFDGTDRTINALDSDALSASIPLVTYFFAMGFDRDEISLEPEADQINVDILSGILEHTFFGLHKEGLVQEFRYNWGKNAKLSFSPSTLGVELFMWAFGYGTKPTYMFFDPELTFECNERIVLVPGYAPLSHEFPDGQKVTVDGYTYEHFRGQKCPVNRKAQLGDETE